MPNALQIAGSLGGKQTRYAPLLVHKFFKGLWTQRSPFSDAGTAYLIEKFYSGVSMDGLVDGLNVELTNRLTLRRRCGATVFNTQTFDAIQRFYEFRQVVNNAEVIQVIADTQLVVYDVTGPATKTAVWTKSAGAGQSYFQYVNNVLYFGNGVEQKKYFQSGGVAYTQNMGLSIGGSGGGTVTDRAGNGVNGSLSAPNWTNPNNVTSTTNYATVSLSTTSGIIGGHPVIFPASANFDVATQFGFSLTADQTPTGIVITFEAHLDSALQFGADAGFLVYLTKNGALVGHSKTVNVSSAGVVTLTLGSASDLWSTAFTANDINQSTWGVEIQARLGLNNNGTSVQTRVFSIRNVQAAISVSGPPAISVNGSPGTVSAVNGGYEIVYCYENTLVTPPTVSSPTAISNRTGNFTNALGVDVPLVASPDSQTTGIRVFSTLDGGGTFFELDSSPYPNASATVTVDPTQVNLFSQAPNQFQNNPPPTGLINLTFHLGRLMGSVGNIMYYSEGPDTILGNGNEAWDPANNFVLPSMITRFVPLAIGLLIFTTSGLYFSGNGGANQDTPTVPVPFMEGKVAGLMSYNGLDVAGSTIYLVNSKKKQLSIDIATGVGETGFPIGDILANGGPSIALAYAARASGISSLFVPGSSLADLPDWLAVGVYLNVRCSDGSFSGQRLVVTALGGPTTIAGHSYMQITYSQPGSDQAQEPVTGTMNEAGIDPANCYVGWHEQDSTDSALYVATPNQPGAAWWFRMNPAPAPEQGVMWSPRARSQAGFSAVQSIETSPGVHQLLLGPPAGGGQILYRDTQNFDDAGTAYVAYADVGSIVLVHPGQEALVDFITTDCAAVGSRPVVSVLLGEIGGHAAMLQYGDALPVRTPDPAITPGFSNTLYNDRWWASGSQSFAICRHMQVEFAWPAENQANELYTYAIFGAHYQEI